MVHCAFKDLKYVAHNKFADGYELTCLMGTQAIEMPDKIKGKFVLPKARSELELLLPSPAAPKSELCGRADRLHPCHP